MCLSASFTLFTFVSAAAQLEIPETISVLKVDNKPKTLSFFSRSTTLDLAEGKHILLLQYKELFENVDEDDHVTIKSEPFVLLLSVNSGESYTLTHAMQTEEVNARKFSEAPTVSVTNKNKEEIKIYTQNLVDFEARAIFNSMDSNQPSVIQPESNISAERNTEGELVENKNTQAYEMLKYWWQRASKAQQEQFILEVNNK